MLLAQKDSRIPLAALIKSVSRLRRMQRSGSSIASSQVKNDSQRPASHVSSVTAPFPAKRITFFKSGDAQFGGVRMAIHKRSFKCFDALLDDLSQKVPLPFGVRTITTPRGTHSIHRLEQLEDGGCYLCSDRRYVKPIDVEAAGKRPVVWHHSHPHNTRKKPSRPEEPHTGHSNHHYHRHPKRIVLVKNNDPAVRRSIILSRRTARSLRVFMEEISELMQCHVRKLYTLEGRKIDNIQSLMQCPSVLVCVGREPFRPLLLDNLKKHSEEKLPGMSSRSRSSVCSEGHDSKKNVNFGLETKKSIIHPRSDSSNRSTRFSLSSEKSYPNGLCMTPGQSGCVSTCPYTKEVILNDDIEKRVLVNKDGSLSVEMKVRFRLVNDETLQWSTEIKKSTIALNESSSVKEEDRHYLQGKTEYSDPDSNSACEAEETCAPKHYQKHLKESHCQNCCNHCQEYDIWRNPMHRKHGDRKSSSSSASSHKIMHKKTSVDSVRTVSRSSEEYNEQVVEKASCFQQTVEEGDTRVEYCSIRRCCSRSEVSATGAKLKSRTTIEDTCESAAGSICQNTGTRNPNTAEFGNALGEPSSLLANVTEDRPISAISNSSKVLQSLKEDKDDDDYDDLPPSASRTSEWSQSDHPEMNNRFRCVHCYGCEASPNSLLSPRPPSKVSSCSAHSSKHKKYRNGYAAPEVPHQREDCADVDRTDSTRSSVSKVSSRSHSCHCEMTTPCSVASEMQTGLEDGIQITTPEAPAKSHIFIVRTNSSRSGVSDVLSPQDYEEGVESENRSISAISANTNVSGKSKKSSVCHCCGGNSITTRTQETQAQEVEVMSPDGRPSRSPSCDAFANSGVSTPCAPQKGSPVSNVNDNCELLKNNREAGDIQVHSDCALSDPSDPAVVTEDNLLHTASVISEEVIVENVEKRTKSAMSMKSNASTKSNTSSVIIDGVSKSVLEKEKAENIIHDRPVSSFSGKLHSSRSSHKSQCSKSERRILTQCNNVADVGNTLTPTPTTPEIKCDQEPVVQDRADSAVSNSSKTSVKSNTSSRGLYTEQENAKSTGCKETENTTTQDSGMNFNERVSSAMSAKTHSSSGSHSSHKSNATTSLPNAASPKSEKPTSALSQSSMKSNPCSATPTKSLLKPTDVPAVQEAGIENGNAPNSSSRNSPSAKKKKKVPVQSGQKSPVTTEGNSRAASALSVNSKASSKSTRSNKSHSHSSSKSKMVQLDSVNDGFVKTTLSNASEKSTAKLPAPSRNHPSEEPLSPTSTASVSLGFGEVEKCDDENEQPLSYTSQIAEDGCQSERCTPEAIHDAGNLEIVENTEKIQIVASERTASSQGSNRSRVTLDSCKSPERSLSPSSVANPTNTERTESKARIQLQNGVPSALSMSSDISHSMSPSRTSQRSGKTSTIKGSKGSSQTANAGKKETNAETEKTSAVSRPSSKCSLNILASGKASPTGSAKSKDEHITMIKNDSCLEIKGKNQTSDSHSDAGSVQSLKASKLETGIGDENEQTSRGNSLSVSDTSQHSQSPVLKMPNKSRIETDHLESSDSILSHTLSAADLLRETVDNIRKVRRGPASNASGKNCVLEESNDNGAICEKSSRCKQRKTCTSSLIKGEDQGLELMPSSLPNASPTEIVNEWLRKIPVDCAYEMEGELIEQYHTVPHILTENEESLQMEKEQMPENVEQTTESQEMEGSAGDSSVKIDGVSCQDTQEDNATFKAVTVNMDPSSSPDLTKRDSLPKRCHSSVQIMKVLLSPKLDRCNSLPDVSPVYGRRLSTSAKGLIECLSNLQLIDPNSDKDGKYNEIISILQSLWIYNPSESKQEAHQIKDQPSAEDDFNPRSSSGVDVSSGSIGSGKGSVNGVVEKSETIQVRMTSAGENVVLQELQQEAVIEGKQDALPNTLQSADTSHALSDSVTPDIAERMRFSPEDEKLNEDQQTDEALQASEEEIQSNENHREINENTTAFSDKKEQENDDDALKSTADIEKDQPGHINAGTSPSAQRGVLTRRVSQDPDPVWVLSLLKKLENQFMSHYANAMAEFKVKWDLNENEMLDIMISELKAEVHKRIQASINRELQKIQSRAGRTPRPPIGMLSRDSTVQTEHRRRRLKVMREQSIDPALSRSDDMNTASGTEFSDQRSEDEFCPCDTCMKKKMASKAIQRAEALSLAPVLMDFDLRKILQTKKSPDTATEKNPENSKTFKHVSSCGDFLEQRNLEIVQEEAEMQNDMKSHTHKNTEDVKDDEQDAAGAAAQPREENVAVSEGEGQTEDGKAIEDGEVGEEAETVEGETETGKEEVEEGKTDTDEDANDRGEEEENEGRTMKMEAEEVEDITEDGEATKGVDAVDEKTLEGEVTVGVEEEQLKENDNIESDEIKKEVEDEVGIIEQELAVEGAAVEKGEEILETPMDGEIAEEGTVEESANDGKETGEEIGETQSEIHEESGDNLPSADATKAESGENETADTSEGKTAEDVEPLSDDVEDENKSFSAQPEDGEQADTVDYTTDKKMNDIGAGSTDEAENHTEHSDNHSLKDNKNNDKNSSIELKSDNATRQSGCKDSNCKLTKQITKTSVESQPGSLEDSKYETVKSKLKDIHSFMESSESEDDLVVIKKQSPFTERRNKTVRPGNKDEVENEVIEWQVSPKRRNRSPARTNKQRRPKDIDFKVDDLEF